MGQLIDFYAGDPQAIGTAVSEANYDSLGDTQLFPLHVDFSLHLSPIDFEILTAEMRKIVGSGPESLLDSFEARVGGDGEECSADIVSRPWVQMVGTVRDDQLEPLISAWTRAMAEEHSDPHIVATLEMRQALTDLVGLCREAVSRGLPVVHVWSL